MQFVTVGVDYTTAPLGVRERFSLAGPSLDTALRRLHVTLGEGLILSTCNRTEYYALADTAAAGRRILTSLLLEHADSRGPVSDSCFTSQSGEGAVHRLFAIASGTRSMVTGESDILRQLKLALARAQQVGAAGPSIHRLGAAALAVGKRVRQTTAIGRRRASVVSVALDRARQSLADTIQPRTVIVGSGDTAERSLRYLERRAMGRDVTVIGRRTERTRELADRSGARSEAWEGLAGALQEADLVVCCTSAPGHVIDPRMILGTQRSRRHAPLVLVDLATPRDVDPMVRNIGGVTLVDLDEVERLAHDDDARHRDALAAAEQVITEHVARYMNWWQNRRVAPTIAAFVARGTAIRDTEVQRTLAQLGDLTDLETRAIQQLATRLTNKLMHAPLAALNRQPDAAMLDALHLLFDLPPRDEAPPLLATERPSCPPREDTGAPDGVIPALGRRPPLTALDRSTR